MSHQIQIDSLVNENDLELEQVPPIHFSISKSILSNV